MTVKTQDISFTQSEESKEAKIRLEILKAIKEDQDCLTDRKRLMELTGYPYDLISEHLYELLDKKFIESFKDANDLRYTYYRIREKEKDGDYNNILSNIILFLEEFRIADLDLLSEFLPYPRCRIRENANNLCQQGILKKTRMLFDYRKNYYTLKEQIISYVIKGGDPIEA